MSRQCLAPECNREVHEYAYCWKHAHFMLQDGAPKRIVPSLTATVNGPKANQARLTTPALRTESKEQLVRRRDARTRSSSLVFATSTISSTRLPATYICSTPNARLRGATIRSLQCDSNTAPSIRLWDGQNTSARLARSKDVQTSLAHTENATSTMSTDRSPRNRRTNNDRENLLS